MDLQFQRHACPRVLLLLAKCDHLLACLPVICAAVHQPMRGDRLFVCLLVSATSKASSMHVKVCGVGKLYI